MTVTISGTSGISTPGVNSTGSNVLGDNVADTLNVGNNTLVTDSSGNVCVGTTTALATGANRGNVTINGSSGAIVAFGVSNSVKGYLFQDSSTMYLVNSGGGSTNFEVNGSERMRIDTSGNLLVGKTVGNIGSVGVEILSNGTVVSTHDGDAALALKRGSNPGEIAQFYAENGSKTGWISINTSGTTYNTSSDYRLKENVQPMQNALAKVAQLNPVTYNWKYDGSDGQGFIAHELQAVVPDCVTGEKDAVDADGKPVYQGIDTSFLVATLTKAIQELTERVVALENK